MPQRSDRGIEVVTIGEITEIDPESRLFELRSRKLGTISQPGSRRDTGISGSVSVGIGIGGQIDPDPERSQRIEVEEPGPFPADEPTSPRRPANSFIYTRVLTDEETTIEQDLTSIEFEDLARGDRVTVTGKSDGDKVEASRVVRRRRVGQ